MDHGGFAGKRPGVVAAAVFCGGIGLSVEVMVVGALLQCGVMMGGCLSTKAVEELGIAGHALGISAVKQLD